MVALAIASDENKGLCFVEALSVATPRMAQLMSTTESIGHETESHGFAPFDINEIVGRPLEIVLVEDSIPDARLAIEALRRGDVMHRLSLVRDGEEALRFLFRQGIYARAPRADLVLLDIGLPKINGCEVLKEIKASEDLRDVPVVIMTSSSEHEEYLKPQLPDADCYMRKPVNMDRLLEVVSKLRAHWLSDVILPT